MFQGDPQSQDPVVHDNGITYMFIQHNNVYLLIAARQNCNAASMLLFLHRVVDVSSIGTSVAFILSMSVRVSSSLRVLFLEIP